MSCPDCPSRFWWFLLGLLFCRCECAHLDGCRDLPRAPDAAVVDARARS